ncbi:hypothetical protein [Aeromicrobium sp. CnD17-E]|uniref:hypothetical protein n=1 Tax=Aeromicrobium sp. CnD17-E TaxID=2954487 RepID=UPI002097B104|nr:hypothetical protein [Aeromicrobium sp. CnD17-E]MCO7237823.1 hypothetical protein [Aeromicrobium sp. CnD17-E]
MPSRRRVSMDPSVGPVEELLDAAASRSSGEVERRAGRVVASHAIWLCPCDTDDDAPTWLVYTRGGDGIGWLRVEDGMDLGDVVEAQRLTGCHLDPGAVLSWVRGEWSTPWGAGQGDDPLHSDVFDELQRRILASQDGPDG